jgi:hypothetical protein
MMPSAPQSRITISGLKSLPVKEIGAMLEAEDSLVWQVFRDSS